MFKFLKSMHILISPFFFLTGTIFSSQRENLRATMILASIKFLISFSIMGSSLGFILISLCFKGT